MVCLVSYNLELDQDYIDFTYLITVVAILDALPEKACDNTSFPKSKMSMTSLGYFRLLLYSKPIYLTVVPSLLW